MLRDDSTARDYDADVGVSVTAPTEDFDMQVMLDDGFFHREMDYQTSACDKPIPHVGNWRRIQKYEGRLCEDGCYSEAELARAHKRNAEIKAEQELDEPMFSDETQEKWHTPRRPK